MCRRFCCCNHIIYFLLQNKIKNIMKKIKNAKIIKLKDIFLFGAKYLFPRKPVSLYRYIEHLIEIILPLKFNYRYAIEIGPGSDSIFSYLETKKFESISLIDYNNDVLQFNKKLFKDSNFNFILKDVDTNQDVSQSMPKADYIVANSFLEHIKNDQGFIHGMHSLLNKGGIMVCSTVLHKKLFNEWDTAMGHYRRYTVEELFNLFSEFNEIQIIQTSIIQELVRPLFFSRIRYLLKNSLEENNWLFGEGHHSWGKPPYSGIWPVIRFLMPFYLCADWATNKLLGGICFIIARK